MGEVRMDDLCLGSTSPKKVIHHKRCPHALTDYVWAREIPNVETLAVYFKASGAWQWHHACQACCGDLDDALRSLGVVLA